MNRHKVMKSRIDDIPKLSTEPVSISASHYNQVRLGILRLENPLRIPLPRLRGMDIIINDKAWVCVDRTLYDLPVLAWTDFEVSHRDSLHTPVRCQLNFYHIEADLISETVLNALYKEIILLLNQQDLSRPHDIGRLTSK